MTAQLVKNLPLRASYGGPYDTLQEAQNALRYFLVGRSYPCHEVWPETVTPIPPSLILDSDVPLSFSPSKDVIFNQQSQSTGWKKVVAQVKQVFEQKNLDLVEDLGHAAGFTRHSSPVRLFLGLGLA